jgi:hypothetical protein
MTRRDALRALGAVGASAALPLRRETGVLPATRPVFSLSEGSLVSALAEHIIPGDGHSPGAEAAGVTAFITRVVALLPAASANDWRNGLAAIDAKCKEMFGRSFVETTVANQAALLTEISRNEQNPSTAAERFFRRIKDATIDAYYTSRIGLEQELGYKGNGNLDQFLGCTHAEHQ